ncbi:MAG: S26 family signal peptidase [Lachnospiraceae bacterium]
MDEKQLCSMVKDLSALYAEGNISAETKVLIEDHLKVCGGCRECYETQQAECSRSNLRYQAIAKKIKRRRVWMVGIAVALAVIFFVIYSFMFQMIRIDGSCMSLTLEDGGWYVLNKWQYKVAKPEQNDVIVYERDGVYYTARVISDGEDGLAEEEYLVAVDDGAGVIDDEKFVNRREIIGKVILR